MKYLRLLRPTTAALFVGALCSLTPIVFPRALAAAEKLEPVDKAWFEENYTKYEHRVPMRDGVKLFTAVYAPKDTSTNYPVLLIRTPYGIRPYGDDTYPEPSGWIRNYAREKFIFAQQDVRGRNGSEGEFLHMRPIKPDKRGPGDTDESTDAWDAIDWLVKNVPNNSGKAGLTGISTAPGIAYAEAKLIIVCKKGFSTMTTKNDPPKGHKLFFGEIVAVWQRK